MRILVTGGCGFIGSAVVRHVLTETDLDVVNVDKLTYAANPDALAAVKNSPHYAFEQADIADAAAMTRIFQTYAPDAVMNLAAETHVDRSIDGPAAFVSTNVVGTQVMLEVARSFWQENQDDGTRRFRFHHISTDEVYGSLGQTGAFSETTAYAPNSPYAASKAGADHLVRAWGRTYGLPVILTNCSNNYGPWQFPEKLVPLMIAKALRGEPLPVYGDGLQVRDWLHVEDHAEGLLRVLLEAAPGSRYNLGGGAERRNIQVVERICDLLDRLAPKADGSSYRTQITFVEDRPGHDTRYAVDTSRIKADLGWAPRATFDSGLEQTVRWYLDHRAWWETILDTKYRGQRLGAAS